MSRAGVVATRVVLPLLSVAIGIGSVEAVGRALYGAPIFFDQRVVFFSSETWRLDGAGALRYAPDRTLRSVALYGNHVEYDVRFEVNDLGFVDTRDYGATPRRREHGLAIVGDSLTAGFHGGTPWVPALQERARRRHPDLQIFNLGIGGTGIRGFLKLLDSVDTELSFGRIGVVLISDDVRRVLWTPVERGEGLWMCRNDILRAECLSKPTRLLVLRHLDASDSELFEMASQRGLIQQPRGPLEWLIRNSFLASRWLRIDTVEEEYSELAPEALQAIARGWAARLAERFPDREISVLQLPEKREIARGELVVDVSDAVKAAGIRYVSLLDRCGLSLDDYFQVDEHPNAQGYAKIAQCVGEALDLM